MFRKANKKRIFPWRFPISSNRFMQRQRSVKFFGKPALMKKTNKYEFSILKILQFAFCLSFFLFVFFTPCFGKEFPFPNFPEVLEKFLKAARDQVNVTVLYDPSYVKIPFPNGDVPIDRGVCSDVLIRAFRKIGFDLQKDSRSFTISEWVRESKTTF